MMECRFGTPQWLYLAAIVDCFSRRVAGWSMADHLRTELVADALEMAIARRRPGEGLIHHSDAGTQLHVARVRAPAPSSLPTLRSSG